MDILSFKAKDLVWAKMKGFSPWPAMVVDPPENMLRVPKKNVPSRCVFFFGSKNYAWIETTNIKLYDGVYKEDLIKQGKSNAFKDAVDQIENYKIDPTETDSILLPPANSYDSDADFNKVRDGDTNENTASPSSVGKNTPPPKRARSKAKSMSAKSLRKTATVSSSKRKRDASLSNDTRKKVNTDFLTASSSKRSATAVTLLDRPLVTRPEAPAIDMNTNSTSLINRNITPSPLTFGFLGLGIMGSTIVKNLICSGHKVVVWNRTPEKCAPFVAAGAEVKETPSDVVEACEIIFCCVSDPKASKELVFGNCGVLKRESLNGKGFVEMSTIDPETSQDIAHAIKITGGRYLEAQIQGTVPEAEEGNLVLLSGGERSVFDQCHSCFKSIAKNTFFLGSDTGNACKVNLILQTILGVSLVGLSEALALADRFSISLKDIMDILELTSLKSGLLLTKGKEMSKGDFLPQHPLSHMQKDLRLVLDMAEAVDQSMPTTAIANEVFKHAKRLGYSDHDSSAVYVRARF